MTDTWRQNVMKKNIGIKISDNVKLDILDINHKLAKNNNIKKAVCCLGVMAMCLAGKSANALAYDVPQVISVGLESLAKNVSSVHIENTKLYLGVVGDDGNFIEFGSLSSPEGFNAVAGTNSYIRVLGEFTQSDAEQMANTLKNKGFSAFVGLNKSGFTVYVSNSTEESVGTAIARDVEFVTSFQAYKLTAGNQSYIFNVNENQVLKGDGEEDTFRIYDKSYRGYLSFTTNAGVITPVNVIDMDQYLYGVVPMEMHYTFSEEALKSQAVAARTYAISKVASHGGGDYNTCDKTHCQVYNGYGSETFSTTESVDATTNNVVLHDGQPIQAFFFSSSGGYTENSENVWYDALPYLRAVEEVATEENADWSKKLTASEIGSAVNVGVAKEVVITKMYTGGRVKELTIIGSNGTAVITGSEIRSKLGVQSTMFNINEQGGDIATYDGAFLGNGNMIYTPINSDTTNSDKNNDFLNAASKGIILKTEGSLKDLDGTTIKVVYDNTESATRNTENTESATDYTVENVVIRNTDDYVVNSVYIPTANATGNFLFEGYGYGHGVGLSQKGAEAMAKMGYDYVQILTHYYTDVTIQK